MNYLEAHQMRALSAPGRKAMMSHLAQSEPDLAILDLRLGQDNGLDLLRDIRSRPDADRHGGLCIPFNGDATGQAG